MNRRGFMRLVGGLGLLALSPIKAPAAPVKTWVENITVSANWGWDADIVAGPITLAELQRMKETIKAGRSMPDFIPLSWSQYKRIRGKLEAMYYGA